MDTDLRFRQPAFASILWPAAAADECLDDVAVPDCFHDLNLDQVETALTADWRTENLAPFFRTPLASTAVVAGRQAVFRDLEQPELRMAIAVFTARMRAVNAALAGHRKLYYARERQRGLLGAAAAYCTALQTLHGRFAESRPASPGLRAFQSYLAAYLVSAPFTGLSADTQRVLASLDGVRYELLVRSGSVTVRPYADELDAGAEVLATFARFRDEAAKTEPAGGSRREGWHGLNHVEAQVLDKVALRFPEPFAALDDFCGRHATFVEATVARFAREVCFYLAWLHYIEPLRAAGLPFCYPEVRAASGAVAATSAFDVALAAQRIAERQPVVTNGFALGGIARMLMVSGPNNGGKTTFARMVAQLHWLAALGCCVPGRNVRTCLFDHLYTHFERQEDAASQRGKLQDDLLRIHAILAGATSRSVVILNEIFASTTLQDAISLGRRIMARLSALDALVVCVTFLDELATFDEKTVSMVAEVDPVDPGIRTFRITQRPPDGLAYALAVARKYRVTREGLLGRIAP